MHFRIIVNLRSSLRLLFCIKYLHKILLLGTVLANVLFTLNFLGLYYIVSQRFTILFHASLSDTEPLNCGLFFFIIFFLPEGIFLLFRMIWFILSRITAVYHFKGRLCGSNNIKPDYNNHSACSSLYKMR